MYILSLGTFCLSSTILKNLGYKKYSLPFDWVFSSKKTIFDCLNDNFNSFLDKSQFYEGEPYDGNDCCSHKIYGKNFFNHRNPSNKKHYDYYIRCIERWNEYISDPCFFLYIFKNNSDKFNINEMNNLSHLICSSNEKKIILSIELKSGNSTRYDYESNYEYNNITYINIIFTYKSICTGISLDNLYENTLLHNIVKYWVQFYLCKRDYMNLNLDYDDNMHPLVVNVTKSDNNTFNIKCHSDITNDNIERLKLTLLEFHQNKNTTIDISLNDGIDNWDNQIFSYSIPYNSKLCKEIPDPDFSKFYRYINLKDHVSWSDKKTICFWRGSSTGNQYNHTDYMKNMRILLCLLSKKHSNILNAKLTSIVNFSDENTKTVIENLNIMDNFIGVNEFFEYKYLIDIDGNYNSWSGCFSKLLSNSVVFKVDSDYKQWFYDRLKPFVHYIPVNSDLSNLNDMIYWAERNDNICKQIAVESTNLLRIIQIENYSL